jgi:hypothetical protein
VFPDPLKTSEKWSESDKNAAMGYEESLDKRRHPMIASSLICPRGGTEGMEGLNNNLVMGSDARAIVSNGQAVNAIMPDYASQSFKGCVSKPLFMRLLT